MAKSLKMRNIPENLDIDVIRNRIVQRPNDINRLVCEILTVDERSVIYTPRFKLTYKCLETGKQASIEFDAVTNRQITRVENAAVATVKEIVRAPIPKTKEAINWLKTKITGQKQESGLSEVVQEPATHSSIDEK